MLTKKNAGGYESYPPLNPHQELSYNSRTSQNLQQTFNTVKKPSPVILTEPKNAQKSVRLFKAFSVTTYVSLQSWWKPHGIKNVFYPENIYLFKVGNWCKICSKLTKKTPERRRRPLAFNVNLEHILNLFPVFYFKFKQVNVCWVDAQWTCNSKLPQLWVNCHRYFSVLMAYPFRRIIYCMVKKSTGVGLTLNEKITMV